MSKEDLPLFNMDNPEHKKFAVNYVKNQRGIIQLTVTHPRKGKTLSQLAYIWGSVYRDLAPGLSQAWGEHFDADRVHRVMKREFLSRAIVNKETGEPITWEIVGLRDLDVEECSRYIENLIGFGLTVGVTVRPAAQFETEAA
jgi:hypothetical protein